MDSSLCQSELFRGGTILWRTRFYDTLGVEAQPISAQLTIDFRLPDQTEGTASVAMSPPTGPGQPWTALWDSRGAAAGTVFWSIHSSGGAIPIAVEDGQFAITANLANAVTF